MSIKIPKVKAVPKMKVSSTSMPKIKVMKSLIRKKFF